MALAPHIASLADLKGRARLARAVTRSPARRAAFEATYSIAATDDLEEVLSDPAVDAVILLTPPDSHRDLGGHILSAGKHLLIEKPAGLVTDDARLLADRAKAWAYSPHPSCSIGTALPFELWRRSFRLEHPGGSAAFIA